MPLGNSSKEWLFIEDNVTPFALKPLYDKIYGSTMWKVCDGRLYVHASVVPVRRFPHDFGKAAVYQDLELVSSFNERKVEEQCRMLNGNHPDDWQHITLQFNGCEYFVAARGIELFQKPRQSRSSQKGSRALYFGVTQNSKRSYLLQYLPPYSPTSSHYHNGIQESFFVIEGSVLISIGGRTYTALPTNALTTPCKVAHSLLTEELPSLTLILMDGSDKGFSSDDHHYLDTDIRSLGCPRYI